MNEKGENKNDVRAGLSLFELVIAVALIVLIAGVYYLVGNPAGQLAGARNSTRLFHLQTIMNGVRQNIADQTNEQFLCASGPLPTSSKRMTSAAGGYNIAPCIIPTYLFNLPFDPIATSGHYTSNSDYDTGYNISINSTTGQITLSAPFAELGKTISVTR